jgi:PAS domain S-box-containing protein
MARSEAGRTGSAEELTRLREQLVEKLGVVTGEPVEVIGTLLEALLRAPGLGFAWVGCIGSEGGPIQTLRVAESRRGRLRSREISKSLASVLGDSPSKWPAQAALPAGGRALVVAIAKIGVNGELGVLVGGSESPAFPQDTERVALDLVADQAAVALYRARLLAAQQPLAVGREPAHAVLEHLPAGIALMAADGELEFANRQLLEYFGRDFEELKGSLNADAIHPEDRPRSIERFLHSITWCEPLDNEQRLLRHDGVYRWFHVRGHPLRDAGRVIRWCVLHTDIDQRKRAEDALRDGERESRLIVDSIPGFVAAFNPAGELDFVNRRVLDYFGKTMEELRHWATDGSLHPHDTERVTAAFKRSFASGEPFDVELRALRFDGSYRWFQSRYFPLRDGSGQIVRWYNLLTDIEDRKQAEVELKRAYDSFADGQRLSRTGNFTADIVADNHIWSEECYRLFEIDPAKRISVQMVRELIHPEDLPVFDARFQDSLGGADFDLVFRITTARGTEKFVHAVGRLVERVAGRPLFIGALRDVTEAKLAEEALNRVRTQLAHVARVSTLSTLTASITHEVNQPLSGMITNAGTCLRMLELDPPNLDGARETARRTVRDGKRAADVVARMRALFSKKEFTVESVDLNEATREVLALSLSELQRNRVVLQSELADDLPRVTGDRVQLQQVILNLLRNASDAMVDVDDRPRKLLVKTERENDGGVRLSVRDAGVGIGAESAETLFEAFYTTKSGGMGIGLSVSRSIVERHQGRLWAEENDGPGACFAFSIPCVPPGAQSPDSAAAELR